MPLLDHFHPPVSNQSRWVSFHNTWSTMFVGYLNELLPRRFLAESSVHLGPDASPDVAEVELVESSAALNGAVAVAVATWSPPAATATVPLVVSEEITVEVIDTQQNGTVVAVIELVSPANKDRATARQTFAAKCAAYLNRGLGLIVVDIVTSRNAGFFAALMALLDQSADAITPNPPELHAAAYRPVRRGDRTELDLWLHPLTIGGDLPVLPLWLRGTGAIRVDLETIYTRARTISRL